MKSLLKKAAAAAAAQTNAEEFLKPYTDAIYNAGNSEDIKKAGSDLQIAIANNMSIKPETKTALLKA